MEQDNKDKKEEWHGCFPQKKFDPEKWELKEDGFLTEKV